MPRLHKSKNGFTLIELLIVITIVGLLTTMAIFTLMNNLGKSRDSKRKADLDRIKIAFEEYYADENTYPPDTILTDCGGATLKPYLSTIPCDPRTKQPYCYIYDADYNGQNYRLLSSLEYSSDPIISTLGCNDPDEYCGYETECTTLGSGFNYGVSSSNVVVANENIGSGQVGASPTPTPSPTSVPIPSTIPGVHGCSKDRICRTYSNPLSPPHNCNVTWADDYCENYCPTLDSSLLCDD